MPNEPVPQPVSGVQPHPPTVDNTALVDLTRQAVSVGHRPRTNYLLDDSIVAKPLAVGDGFFNLKPKSSEIIFRAIAFNINPTHCDNPYLRYEQAKIQGYVNATKDDVAGEVAPAFLKDNGARITNGDLILMKISRALYSGALKWKDQQAMRATKKVGVIDDANQQIARAMQETNIPTRLGRKLQPFTPSEGEIRKDFGG